MIISHSKKFIFIKTKKTAGSSLEMALSRYCDDDDVLTPLCGPDEVERLNFAGVGARNYAKPFFEQSSEQKLKSLLSKREYPVYSEHMPAVEIIRRLGQERWNEYFKFTIVRNPYDRCVSRFFWTLNRGSKQPGKWGVDTLSKFVRYFPEYVNENWNLYTVGDEILVDYAVRYEHLESDLAHVSERIGLIGNLAEDMRKLQAKAGFRPNGVDYASLIGPEERVIIRNLCIGEVNKFGYTFDGFLSRYGQSSSSSTEAELTLSVA
jgi:hypothetical protein